MSGQHKSRLRHVDFASLLMMLMIIGVPTLVALTA